MAAPAPLPGAHLEPRAYFVLDEATTPDIRRRIDAARIYETTTSGALEIRRGELNG